MSWERVGEDRRGSLSSNGQWEGSGRVGLPRGYTAIFNSVRAEVSMQIWAQE